MSLGATTDFAIWSVVELGIGIIVISLPSIRPLLRKIPFFAAMSTTGSNDTPDHPNDNTKKRWWSSGQSYPKLHTQANDTGSTTLGESKEYQPESSFGSRTGGKDSASGITKTVTSEATFA
jgi:hypothetical protein